MISTADEFIRMNLCCQSHELATPDLGNDFHDWRILCHGGPPQKSPLLEKIPCFARAVGIVTALCDYKCCTKMLASDIANRNLCEPRTF
jgi:hypothetical protein